MIKCLLLCLVLMLGPASAPAAPIPSWFRENPARPYAIFDGPKHLSTAQAVVYLGAQWHTLGGRLEDAQGHPVPLCHLALRYFGGIRGYSADLTTDTNGYFLVYSPYDLSGKEFKAAPGYPDTSVGAQYAASQNDVKACVSSLLYQTGDRAFYQLSVDTRNKFSAEGYAKFEQALAADLEKQQNEMPKLPAGASIGGSKEAVVTTFLIRLLDPRGLPLASALVSLGGFGRTGFGFSSFGTGSCLTDADGDASLTETALFSPLPKTDYRRVLIVDAPGSSFGPSLVTLDPKQRTVVMLDTPAAVAGKVTNAAGLPDSEELTVAYEDGTGTFDFRSRPDGTFVFPRIVSGRPFRMILNGFSYWQTTPAVPVESRVLMLRPGQTLSGIRLQAVTPAALRGWVADAEGRPVPVGEATQYPNEVGLTLLLPDPPAASSYGGAFGAVNPSFPREVIYEGTGSWVWGDLGPGFGFYGLGAGPFRLRVTSEKYAEYLSSPIFLKPGELGFVKIVLHRKSQALKSTRKSSL